MPVHKSVMQKIPPTSLWSPTRGFFFALLTEFCDNASHSQIEFASWGNQLYFGEFLKGPTLNVVRWSLIVNLVTRCKWESNDAGGAQRRSIASTWVSPNSVKNPHSLSVNTWPYHVDTPWWWNCSEFEEAIRERVRSFRCVQTCLLHFTLGNSEPQIQASSWHKILHSTSSCVLCFVQCASLCSFVECRVWTRSRSPDGRGYVAKMSRFHPI